MQTFYPADLIFLRAPLSTLNLFHCDLLAIPSKVRPRKLIRVFSSLSRSLSTYVYEEGHCPSPNEYSSDKPDQSSKLLIGGFRTPNEGPCFVVKVIIVVVSKGPTVY